jgi:hypothetical protein
MDRLRIGPCLLKNDGSGYWTGSLRLPGWGAVFGVRRGRLYIEIAGEGDDGHRPPAAARTRGCRWLIAHDAAVARETLAGILAWLPTLRPGYAKAGIVLPEARSIEELAQLVTPSTAIFHTARRGTRPYIGYTFRCAWDDEHGVGVLMHGLRLLSVGGADTAHLEWIAERDARTKAGTRR